jgi:hypothetical protein
MLVKPLFKNPATCHKTVTLRHSSHSIISSSLI